MIWNILEKMRAALSSYVPNLRWMALQSKHMNTPNVADAQDGFLDGQSKHILFSGFDLNLLSIAFFS